MARTFLVLGILLVGLLTWKKQTDNKTKDEGAAAPVQASANPPLAHVTVNDSYVLAHPVMREEFEQFCLEAGYTSWRERQGLSPTWKDGRKGEPVSWMTPSDAENYSAWLSRKHGGTPFQLPTIDQLKAVGSLNWEWSRESMPGGYRTAYHPEEGSRSRRERDLVGEEALPAGFRVAWAGAPR